MNQTPTLRFRRSRFQPDLAKKEHGRRLFASRRLWATMPEVDDAPDHGVEELLARASRGQVIRGTCL
jgi:hypothetical protein